jgi:hypothetical protein
MRGHFFALFSDLIFPQTQRRCDVDAGFLIVAFSDLTTPRHLRSDALDR